MTFPSGSRMKKNTAPSGSSTVSVIDTPALICTVMTELIPSLADGAVEVRHEAIEVEEAHVPSPSPRSARHAPTASQL